MESECETRCAAFGPRAVHFYFEQSFFGTFTRQHGARFAVQVIDKATRAWLASHNPTRLKTIVEELVTRYSRAERDLGKEVLCIYWALKQLERLASKEKRKKMKERREWEGRGREAARVVLMPECEEPRMFSTDTMIVARDGMLEDSVYGRDRTALLNPVVGRDLDRTPVEVEASVVHGLDCTALLDPIAGLDIDQMPIEVEALDVDTVPVEVEALALSPSPLLSPFLGASEEQIEDDQPPEQPVGEISPFSFTSLPNSTCSEEVGPEPWGEHYSVNPEDDDEDLASTGQNAQAIEDEPPLSMLNFTDEPGEEAKEDESHLSDQNVYPPASNTDCYGYFVDSKTNAAPTPPIANMSEEQEASLVVQEAHLQEREAIAGCWRSSQECTASNNLFMEKDSPNAYLDHRAEIEVDECGAGEADLGYVSPDTDEDSDAASSVTFGR